MKKIITLVLVVVVLNALLWWLLRIRENGSRSRAVVNGTVQESLSTPAPLALPVEALPESPGTNLAEEVVPAPEEKPVVTGEKPWLPYVGTWAGSTVCHDITYREGEELICAVKVVVGVDGMCTLETSRKFKSDGLVHGQFFDKAMWPGEGFDERDGRFHFSSPDSGVFQVDWLSTREQMVEVALGRVNP